MKGPVAVAAVRRLPTNRIARIVAAVVILGAGSLVLAGHRDPPAPDATQVLAAREHALEAQLTLAGQDRPYLLLDPARGTLGLYRGAALLVTWPVSGLDVGSRRVWPGRGREGWRSGLWENGRLEPPVRRERRIIESDQVQPPDPTGEVEWIPPTPEEEVPTPGRYFLHFDGGLGVEITAPGADTLPVHPGLGQRTRATLARLSPANWDRYRMRITMQPADAGALYRGLPPDVAFVAVLP